MNAYLISLWAITRREALRFVNQRSRFLAALVRPLVWLVVFAAGFRAALGLSIIVVVILGPEGIVGSLRKAGERYGLLKTPEDAK